MFRTHLRASIVTGPSAFFQTIGRTTGRGTFGYLQFSFGVEVADVLRIDYKVPLAAPTEVKDLLRSFVSFTVTPRVNGKNP